MVSSNGGSMFSDMIALGSTDVLMMGRRGARYMVESNSTPTNLLDYNDIMMTDDILNQDIPASSVVIQQPSGQQWDWDGV